MFEKILQQKQEKEIIETFIIMTYINRDIELYRDML
jgi:hypothetical protein